MAPMFRAQACAPPLSALKYSDSPVLTFGFGASTLRSFFINRCAYSSHLNSSVGLTLTWLSDPIPKLPPLATNSSAGKIPSPKFASVVGQIPTTALLVANCESSLSFKCVA